MITGGSGGAAAGCCGFGIFGGLLLLRLPRGERGRESGRGAARARPQHAAAQRRAVAVRVAAVLLRRLGDFEDGDGPWRAVHLYGAHTKVGPIRQRRPCGRHGHLAAAEDPLGRVLGERGAAGQRDRQRRDASQPEALRGRNRVHLRRRVLRRLPRAPAEKEDWVGGGRGRLLVVLLLEDHALVLAAHVGELRRVAARAVDGTPARALLGIHMDSIAKVNSVVPHEGGREPERVWLGPAPRRRIIHRHAAPTIGAKVSVRTL